MLKKSLGVRTPPRTGRVNSSYLHFRILRFLALKIRFCHSSSIAQYKVFNLKTQSITLAG